MVAEKVNAVNIISVTESGSSCLKISAMRPQTPVLGITNNIETVRRLCLYWGVTPYQLIEFDEDDYDFQRDIIDRIKVQLSLVNGDKLVITRGDGRFFTRGSSNSVKVETIRDRPRVLGSSETLKEASDDKKRMLLDTSICGSCHSCVQICPHDIWQVADSTSKETTINKEKISSCTLDLECVRVCPTGAIEILPR
jgi:pyruvate kinase